MLLLGPSTLRVLSGLGRLSVGFSLLENALLGPTAFPEDFLPRPSLPAPGIGSLPLPAPAPQTRTRLLSSLMGICWVGVRRREG